MVQTWLRYGRTMVFTDLEDSFEVLQPKQTWVNLEKLTETLANEVGGDYKRLIVDYVHGLSGFDKILAATVSSFSRNGFEVEIFVSSWRYGDSSVERSLFNIVKSMVAELGVKKVFQLNSQKDLSGAVLLSPAVFWDGDVVCCHDFTGFHGFESGFVISPVVGCGGVVTDVVTGEGLQAQYLKKKALEASSYTASKNPEIIIAGGPGHPVDSRLSTCINLASAVLESDPNKVVIYALECSEGLGEQNFVKTLLGKEENSFHRKRVDVWRKATSQHKVSLVTALPSSLIENLLNARQFDTLDQAVVYARRVKSREASILLVENTLGTRLTGF